MMGMDHVCPGQRGQQARRDRMCWVTVKEGERSEGAQTQPAGIQPAIRSAAEADKLALDVAGQRAGQLKRVPFTTPEQPVSAERGGSNVNDAHPDDRPANARRPGSLDRWLPVPSATR